MYENSFFISQVPGIEPEELSYLQAFTKDLPNDKMPMFMSLYNSKRKKADIILLTSLLGFVGFAGVHRFLIGQMGMGILYLFTAGLCFVGTIVDIINHKSLASEYNQQMAVEAMTMVRGV